MVTRKSKAKQAEQYGKVPYQPLDAGLLTRMRNADSAVYLCLCMHLTKYGWTCDPSVIGIARQTGMSKRSVLRSIARLEKMGAITVHRQGGGRGKRNTYTVQRQWTETVTPMTPIKGDTGDTVSDAKGCHSVQERVTQRAPNGDTSGTPTTQKQLSNNKTPDAAVALARERFGEDAAKRCRPHLDRWKLDDLRRLADVADRKATPAGYFIKSVERHWIPRKPIGGAEIKGPTGALERARADRLEFEREQQQVRAAAAERDFSYHDPEKVGDILATPNGSTSTSKAEETAKLE